MYPSTILYHLCACTCICVCLTRKQKERDRDKRREVKEKGEENKVRIIGGGKKGKRSPENELLGAPCRDPQPLQSSGVQPEDGGLQKAL